MSHADLIDHLVRLATVFLGAYAATYSRGSLRADLAALRERVLKIESLPFIRSLLSRASAEEKSRG